MKAENERAKGGSNLGEKTNADWVCGECEHEWVEDNPFVTPGDCPECGSDFVQHY